MACMVFRAFPVLGFALSAVMLPTTVQAEQISLERQFDCMIQAANRHALLTYSRDRGADVSFSDVATVQAFMEDLSYTLGKSVSQLSDAEVTDWKERFNSLSSKADNVVGMVQDLGLEQSLAVTEKRYLDCVALFPASVGD